MRAAVNAFALFGAVLALHMLPAAAEEEGAGPERRKQEGEDQWVPSLAIISGMTVQDWDGEVESEICRDCTFPDQAGEEALRPFIKGDDRDVTPYVGGSLELMSPALPIPTSPRLFVGGEFLSAFGTNREVAGEGDPGLLRSPLPEGAEDSTPYGENAAIGQGSTTKAEIDKFVYGAHAGISFPVELFERALRIKPMFAWIRYDVDVKGKVVDAECQASFLFGSTNCNDKVGNGFQRGVTLRDDDSDTFDGIGPGLDVEMDTGRFGPLGTSLFAGARLYKILGSRKIKLSDSGSHDDVLGQDQTRARWSFEMDDWMYRIGLGIRFQWLGNPGPDLED